MSEHELKYFDKDKTGLVDFRHRFGLDLTPQEKILVATYETILEDQISGTRLRKIASKAGIAQGHLHYYFASKDELFLELLNEMIQAFTEDRETLLQDSSISAKQKLLAILHLKYEIIKGSMQDFVLFDFWVQSASNENIQANWHKIYRPWRQAIEAIIHPCISSAAFKPKYAKLMPSLMISVMDGAALQYLIDQDAFELQEYFQSAEEMITDMLVPSEV